MANEAEMVELGPTKGSPIRLTCYDSIAYAKGAIVAITKERYISGSSKVDGTQKPIGIVAMEKIADDGSTTVSVYQKGLFRVTMSAADEVTAGEMVTISGANLCGELKDNAGIGPDTSIILGRAMEDIGAGERGVIQLCPGGV